MFSFFLFCICFIESHLMIRITLNAWIICRDAYWLSPFLKCVYDVYIQSTFFTKGPYFFSYVYRSRQNSKICILLTETNFIFQGEKYPSRVFRWPNLHDMACDNSTAGLVTADSQFTLGHIDHPAPCAVAIRLHAVPCRGPEAGVKKEPPVQAEGKGISARPPGCWPARSLFASGPRMRVKWSLRHIVLLSRSSSVSAFGRWPAIRCTVLLHTGWQLVTL